jgi:AAHS family 4-hydroxybenzoate transporter-like MFS transporter
MESAKSVGVRSFINERRFSPYQVMILVMCFLIVAVDGFDQAVIGFIAPAIKDDWGLTPSMMAPIFAMSLAGLMIGGLAFGPLADKFGRKTIILLSITIFGLATVASAAVNSVGMLNLLRFMTGLGLGGSFANAVTLVSEYCPERRRSSLITIMITGFPIGSVAAGLLTGLIQPSYGWRGVFIAGGAFPLVLAAVLFWLLPESARYLVTKDSLSSKVKRILKKIDPKFDFSSVVFRVEEKIQSHSPIASLFKKEMLWGTVFLSIAFFMSLAVGFGLISWLPTIIHGFGLSIRTASAISALYQGGGIFGAIVLGWLMDRLGRGHYVVAVAYLIDFVCVAMIGNAHDILMLSIAIFSAGFFNTGCQICINALAAAFFPTGCRATGVSWVNAIGRIGGILGAWAGGLFLTLGWNSSLIFGAIAIPTLFACAAIFGLGRLVGSEPMPVRELSH